MLRTLLIPAILVACAAVCSIGCRACSTCHDYDPPVACCQCGTCGCHRAGSAFADCPNSEGFVYEDEAVMQQPQSVPAEPTCPCQSGN